MDESPRVTTAPPPQRHTNNSRSIVVILKSESPITGYVLGLPNPNSILPGTVRENGQGMVLQINIPPDCIGSAFNAKGVMQCPNCRQIERGNWLYANGSRPSQDVSNDDWGHDEDFYDANQPETSRSVFLPFRFQWCPIGRLAQLPSVFDEGESAPPVTFHDFMGQNFTSEHLPVSAPGATPPGPYIAYFQPLQSSASSSSSHVTERTMDGTTYHDHWNPLPGPSDGRPLATVHPIDFHHNHWTHLPNSYSQPNSNNGVAEQMAIPVVPMRVGGLDSDSQQRGSLPSVYGNGSGSRSRIPSVPPMAPQFMRPHGNINEQYQQNSSSLYAAPQRRTAVQAVQDSMNFTLFPQAPTGPNSMETEDAGGNQFYAWERDRFAPYPLMPVDSEANWWGSTPQSHGVTDHSAAPGRRLFGQWIGAREVATAASTATSGQLVVPTDAHPSDVA
ncbi:hypothetical protein OsJ_01692 [Oryza sativa Japonica Group]|uniref:Uncharacterized protein n=1 Tax=Oryza sativa subsp. japonica TaxID=39947 RepID=B9EWC5_ORYSJ|nr:hypothetical protein OsJ_01692 [Oryza sativa Japonica Group]